MPQVVTLGEPLVQLNSYSEGPLHQVQLFERHVAGSELNFAIGVSRLGISSGLISRVGDDEFGTCVLDALRKDRVDSTHVKVIESGRTGIYFIQRSYPEPGQSVMFYYREGSAASTLSPGDIDEGYVASASRLHLTGITPALSDSCLKAWRKALHTANANHVPVSLDTNIRRKLWSPIRAKEVLLDAIKFVDILFLDTADGEILVGESEPAAIARKIRQTGPKTVVVKLGKDGAVLYRGDRVFHQGGFDVHVVDPVGAGDALASAFMASSMLGWDDAKCLRAGCASGAMATTVRGDNENLPTVARLEEFLSSRS